MTNDVRRGPEASDRIPMKTTTFTRSKFMMSMARKRKSSSPEERLTRSKATKESVSGPQASSGAPLSAEKRKISTPIKGKGQVIGPDTLLPRRQSPRFKCQKQTPCSESIAAGQAQNGESQLSNSPAQHPLQDEEDTELGLVITLDEDKSGGRRAGRKKSGEKIKRGAADGKGDGPAGSGADQEGAGQDGQTEIDICTQLDRDLESKSRQHNLTKANVRNIIHEVITNEQVVAMMKAAIRETQDMPMFEPKMTRSRLKEVVEKGVVIPTWNISPIKKSSEVKPPQFVDIHLEEEDSSDEEYCPDEEEEDETAEETFLESDVESTASSPRGSRIGRPRTPMDNSECDEDRSSSPRQGARQSRHLRVEVVPMGPPPPPQPAGPPRPPRAPPDCTFMEKLHAVEEELAFSPICMEPYQMSDGGEEEDSLVACRTRSKRPLRDVPLGRLEAELRAPDITPDMYDCSSALEDREWTQWLQGLMTSDMENEEEGDDDDDPEYNFLEDLDEPDLEDYRNDRAVRITKKEVNELMEELFETFQDELGVQEHDEEGHEEEEEREEEVFPQAAPKFNVPQAIRFEEPLANMLTERHRTVKEQLEAIHQRRAMLESQARASQATPGPQVLLVPQPCALILTHPQKLQLQQQIQQHIQLLTQVHMLCSPVESLQSEANTTQHFLSELQSFAQRGEQARAAMETGFVSIFRACNLQGALSLLEELRQSPTPIVTPTPASSSSVRSYPLLPPKLAWLLATRPVFLYPELLPHCSLDPALHRPRTKSGYTKGEDSLILLGLKHFGETEFPYQLLCRYLIRTKTHEQVRGRVHDMCLRRAPDNLFKFYHQHKIIPPLPLACGRVMPGEERPPVERDESIMPVWLRKSLPYIHKAVTEYNQQQQQATPETGPPPPPYIFPPGTRYPLVLPKNVTLRLHPAGFKTLRPPSVSKPRPLRGYRPPSFPSLAKAPGNTPTQGVVLLAKAPFTPIQGALPLATAPLTPAHGAVPLNAAYSMPLNPLSQCFGQESGCAVLPAHDVPSVTPPALLQVPAASPLNTPLFSPGGVTACIMQTAQLHTEKPNPRLRPRKLLPIQPAPPKPATQPLQLHNVSAAEGVGALSSGGAAAAGGAAGAASRAGGRSKAGRRGARACSSAPAPVILNLTTPAGTTVICPAPAGEGLLRPSAESTTPPQDPVTHPNGALARLRRLVRPLLPAPPSSDPPQNFPHPSRQCRQTEIQPRFLFTHSVPTPQGILTK
ncbi:hypothetical protein MATL_G00129530 [Megalops atlanticus]|uniref:GON4L n=1 Tax=Megalops atlanticus TaxID=7932 RepID=A0A9D3PXR4_MEGAT|nr:hypothetical protein MATL_G00129530 [Megalops atlanticus]